MNDQRLPLNRRPDLATWRGRVLDAAMDNVIAWTLGQITEEAASSQQKVGDYIDRGLILRRLLDEGGFELRIKPQATAEGEQP